MPTKSNMISRRKFLKGSLITNLIPLPKVGYTQQPHAAFFRAPFQLGPSQQAWVDQTLARMSLEEKLGQLILVHAYGVFTNEEEKAHREINDNILNYYVGGYDVFKGDPLTAAELVGRMQRLAKVGLLIASDFEGGVGQAFQGATRFPQPMAIGATGNPRYAYEAANVTGKEAKAMGFNMNFAPVVDINNNPANPIINVRSFGGSPKLVHEFGIAYVKGLQDAGVIATVKHFPGHGDTSSDSHVDLPVENFSLTRLKAFELVPFVGTINAGVGAIMVGHIALPQIENESDLPASLSYAIITKLLRNNLGFQGIVITDALSMSAITKHYGPDRAVVMAIRAGADVVLRPINVRTALAALRVAVNSGKITIPRLNASVRRLLVAKAWAGLNVNVDGSPDLDRIDRLVGTPAALRKSQEIMEHALTLLKDDKDVLPLRLRDREGVLLVNFYDSPTYENPNIPGGTFRTEFEKRHPRTTYVEAASTLPPCAVGQILQLAQSFSTIVVCCFIRVAASHSLRLTNAQRELLRALAQRKGRLVFSLFGSPYLLNAIPELPSYALAYDYYPGAELAMVRAVFGDIEFQGKLPVAVGRFPLGFSLKR